MSRRRAGAPAVVATAVLLALFAHPGPVAAQSPTADMQQYTDEVVRLVREVTLREKDTLGALQAAVARIALQVFGASEAAREALGSHWVARTPAEQDEFTRLFADLLRRGERWLVHDVVLGGVSLVGNYRAQFDRVIRCDGYAALIHQVAAKRDELLARRRAPQE
jgi:ABC-type transporter MlaC component